MGVGPVGELLLPQPARSKESGTRATIQERTQGGD
jgi:hypothetical protein